MKTTIIRTTTTVVVEEKVSYKGLTGHWSKWGGGRSHAWKEDIKGRSWVCQSCGQAQPSELTPYLYEWAPQEFIRACAPCIANHCIALRLRQMQEDE